MTSPDDNQADLLLLAFRYVSAELDEAECALFERRLESDQPAREAVARAVQVGRAVASTCPEPARLAASDQNTGGQRRFWTTIAAATAAAFLAGIAISHWIPASGSPSLLRKSGEVAGGDRGLARPTDGAVNEVPSRDEWIPATVPNGADGRLLALWSKAETDFGQLFNELTAVAAANGGLAEAGVSEGSMASFGSEAEAEFVVPDWMLAAVSTDDEPGSEPADDGPEEN